MTEVAAECCRMSLVRHQHCLRGLLQVVEAVVEMKRILATGRAMTEMYADCSVKTSQPGIC